MAQISIVKSVDSSSRILENFQDFAEQHCSFREETADLRQGQQRNIFPPRAKPGIRLSRWPIMTVLCCAIANQ